MYLETQTYFRTVSPVLFCSVELPLREYYDREECFDGRSVHVLVCTIISLPHKRFHASCMQLLEPISNLSVVSTDYIAALKCVIPVVCINE
jgi:hypothetical protein